MEWNIQTVARALAVGVVLVMILTCAGLIGPSWPRNAWVEYQVVRQAQGAVREALKAPSTAQFPGAFWNSGEYTIRADGTGRYRVSSWVDAENAFGAKLRWRWTVQVFWWDGKYFVEYVEIDGRVVKDRR